MPLPVNHALRVSTESALSVGFIAGMTHAKLHGFPPTSRELGPLADSYARLQWVEMTGGEEVNMKHPTFGR
jgi:hypothetical protein